MSWLTEALGTEPVQRLGLTLVHFLWQGSAIAALAAVVLALLRESRADARYLVACSAFVATAVAPVVTFSLLEPGATAALGGPADAPVDDPGFGWVAAAWLIGVVLLGARLAGGAWRIRRLATTGSELSADWQERVTRLCDKLGIRRAIRTLRSELAEVPMTFGYLRPVVLIPASAMTGLTVQQIEMVLAHELAHVRRHDFLVNLVQSILETLLFYHPAVWWLSHRVRIEREHCADDQAIRATGDPVAYGRTLVELEAARSPAFALAATSSLRKRVQRIVQPDRHRRSVLPLVIAFVGIALGIAGESTVFESPTSGVLTKEESMNPKTLLAAALAAPIAAPIAAQDDRAKDPVRIAPPGIASQSPRRRSTEKARESHFRTQLARAKAALGRLNEEIHQSRGDKVGIEIAANELAAALRALEGRPRTRSLPRTPRLFDPAVPVPRAPNALRLRRPGGLETRPEPRTGSDPRLPGMAPRMRRRSSNFFDSPNEDPTAAPRAVPLPRTRVRTRRSSDFYREPQPEPGAEPKAPRRSAFGRPKAPRRSAFGLPKAPQRSAFGLPKAPQLPGSGTFDREPEPPAVPEPIQTRTRNVSPRRVRTMPPRNREAPPVRNDARGTTAPMRPRKKAKRGRIGV